MPYAVLSDVHSNLEALETVLKDMDQRKIEDVLFLGDAVGYGPNPNECIELLTNRCEIMLAGNHDWGVLGLTDIAYFNVYARAAIEWTKRVLTEKNRKTLRSFPVKKEMGDILLVHSTPKEPEEWHYLLTLWDAEINFHYFDNKFCFLGHSHQPFIIERLPSGELVTYKEAASIGKTERYIINAGSVGQPRDGNPEACYAAVDDEKMEIVRVPYDVGSVQKMMIKEGLPSLLIERLSSGR
ncbi:MAG: metallophosphoesterase family protein [Thermodesulfovibrionales bacterium]|nr:metallophosphoesterase family protein [Thermodesulfovibrionales bacterium]